METPAKGHPNTPTPTPQALNEHKGVAVFEGAPPGVHVRGSPMLSERKLFRSCCYSEKIFLG